MLGINGFHRAFETSHHIPFCYLPTTAVRVKYLQYNEYANRPAFGYICFNELRNAVAKEQFLLRERAIKVCSAFPNFYKAPRVTFRAFLLLVTPPVSLTRHRFRRRVLFTTWVTLLLCPDISIAKVSCPPCFIANGTVRLDQDSFFSSSLFTLRRFLRKVETSRTSFACISTSFTPRPRASWEIRHDNSDLTKVFVPRRVNLMAQRRQRLNAS